MRKLPLLSIDPDGTFRLESTIIFTIHCHINIRSIIIYLNIWTEKILLCMLEIHPSPKTYEKISIPFQVN